jgi:predicted transposase YdaD
MNDEKRLNGMFAAKLEEGMEKERTELLKNLLDTGLHVEEVSKMTESEVKEVERLTGANK